MDFTKVRSILFLSLLIVVTAGFFFLFKPFFYPIFWAAVIASIFYPLFKKIKKGIRSPRLSALIVMFVVLLVILIPIAALSGLLIKESVDIYNSVENSSQQISDSFHSNWNWIKDQPLIQRLGINQEMAVDRLTDAVKSISFYVFDTLKNITQNSVIFLGMMLLMFYTLYYFLLDGDKFLRQLMHLCPLGDKQEKRLYDKFTTTALGTIKGSIVVGGIQGLLSALLFTVVGLQGAAILGVFTAALCVLPIGSGFVWAPAGIFLLISGQIWQGLLVLLVGALVISTIDNLIRPILVGKETQMHPLLVLFSTLGGIIFFGITGFLIGPIITALLVSFWEMYDDYYKQDLDHN